MDTIELRGQSYNYAFLEEHNFNDLSYLFKQVYNMAVSISYLKHKLGPFTPELRYFGCFMYTIDGVPIGFQGAIPFKLINGDHQILGAQSCDSMTVRCYEGMGVFQFLASQVDELLASRGIRFIYGFPNQNSEGILFKKLGWFKTGNITLFSMNSGSLPLAQIIEKLPLLASKFKRRSFRKMGRLGEVLTSFENSERDDTRLTVLHDDSFFNYKKDASKFILRLQNGIVWLKLSNVIMVGDMVVNQPERMSDLLYELKQLARKVGIRKVIFQCQIGGQNHTLLAPLLHGEPSWQVGIKTYDDQVDLKDFVLTYGDIDTF